MLANLGLLFCILLLLASAWLIASLRSSSSAAVNIVCFLLLVIERLYICIRCFVRQAFSAVCW